MSTILSVTMEFVIRIFVSVVAIIVPFVSGAHILPENIAAEVGQTWEVFYESSSEWFFVNWYKVTSEGKRLLFLNGTKVAMEYDTLAARAVTTMYRDGATVLHTFRVDDTVAVDSGRYIMQDIMARPVVEVSIEVVILERSMECRLRPNPIEAGSVLTVTCRTPYVGHWGPVLDCYGTTLIETNITGLAEDGLSEFNFTGTPVEGTPVDNITCWSYFDSPTTEEYPGLSVTTPIYTDNWLTEIDILYPATTITISPNLDEYEVDDIITCSASGGNPAPTYRWLDSVTAVVLSNTDVLFITADQAEEYVNATCIATTKIGGFDYELLADISFFVKPLPTTTTTTTTTTALPTTPERSTNAMTSEGNYTTAVTRKEKVDERLLIIIIVGTVAALLALILIIILIVCCVKKGKCKRIKTEGINPEVATASSLTPTKVSFNNGSLPASDGHI